MENGKIAPSILATDSENLEEQVVKAEKGGADYIHIDFMDGIFVPNRGVGIDEMERIKKISKLPFDVHLMAENPIMHAENFIKTGAYMLSFHFEVVDNPKDVIFKIKNIKKQIKIGIALNPETEIDKIINILHLVDFVLIMSVHPGKSFQKFIKGSENKIKEIKEIITQNKLQTKIEVDGGINPENAGKLVKCGANILVAGGSIFGQPDIKKATKKLKDIMNFEYT